MPRSDEGGGVNPRNRTLARAWALHVLYRWESLGGDESLREALGSVLRTRRVAPSREGYLRRLVETVEEHLPEVDRVLEAALENWRLERLSVVDRSILRLAAAELLFLEDIPPKVSIQEGIRLAERYGGPDSPRFVNGVLDALYRGTGEPR